MSQEGDPDLWHLNSAEHTKVKWLIYTVIAGFLPIVLRLLSYLITVPGSVDPFSPADFVAFGLVLHISSVNEIEHQKDIEENWKTVQNGISFMLIAVYGAVYVLALLGGELINETSLIGCTIGLAAASLFTSYTVYNRISKFAKNDPKVASG